MTDPDIDRLIELAWSSLSILENLDAYTYWDAEVRLHRNSVVVKLPPDEERHLAIAWSVRANRPERQFPTDPVQSRSD